MTEDLTGNKGEWSEIYVFFRMIADGQIYSADDNTEKTDPFFEIGKIIRKEDKNGPEIHYVISHTDDTVKAICEGKVMFTIDREDFRIESTFLLDSIKNSKGGTFSIPRTEEFMEKISCFKLKAPSSDKSDIVMEIHDHRTGNDSIQGFSIKSKLGSSSTLLNPSKCTNFLFRLDGYDGMPQSENIEFFEGSQSVMHKLSDIYSQMIKKGIRFEFVSTDGTFGNNLSMIDSNMQGIVAEMLKEYYINGISSIDKIVASVAKRNPMGYRGNNIEDMYGYKVKKMLAAIALGMKPGTDWNGIEEANGGYIIVKEDGDVLCYHIYNRNDFENYLFKNTKLDTASTDRFKFSKVFKGYDDKYYMYLNLQIRFK